MYLIYIKTKMLNMQYNQCEEPFLQGEKPPKYK